jgi:AraC family transcriptional regulator
MEPRIVLFKECNFIGMKMKMSFANNKTRELFRNFMPRRKEIKNNIGLEVYCIQEYGDMDFTNLNPTSEYVKWAAVQVTDFNYIPAGFNIITIPNGLYAVFLYKGAASQAKSTFQYIFTTWLPNSKYTLANRPHFDVLGEKYKNEDVNSEEELWIPIKEK